MGEMDLTEPTDTGSDADSIDGVDRAWRELGLDALRLAAALVGPHDAHDVTSTAFLRVTAQASWGQVRDRRAYLLQAVRNEAQNLYRSRGRRWRRDLVAVRPTAHHDEPLDIDVYRALANLSLRQRSVVFFAYWEGLTEAEIAAVLGLSRGTIHRDLQNARHRLRRDLT